MIEAIEVSLEQADRVIADRRQHHADRLGRQHVDHGLAGRQAERDAGLALAAVDGIDAGPKDLRQHGAALQAETEHRGRERVQAERRKQIRRAK